MSTQCRHSLSHVYSSVCIRHSSSQSQKVFLICELESMRPLMHNRPVTGVVFAKALSCSPIPWRTAPLASQPRSACILSDLPHLRPAPSPRPASAWARPSSRLPLASRAPISERRADKLPVTARPPQLKSRRFPTSPDPPASTSPPGARCLANITDHGPKHESDPRLGPLSRRASAASRSRPRRDPGKPRLGIHVA